MRPLCVGDAEPELVANRIRGWAVEILDVPAAAAEVSARAYWIFRRRRRGVTNREARRRNAAEPCMADPSLRFATLRRRRGASLHACRPLWA